MRQVAKYLAYGRAQFASVKEYAFEFTGGIVLLPVEVAMTVVVWKAIYSFTGQLGTFSLPDMLTYQLLVRVMGTAQGQAAAVNYRVWSDIHRGDLSLFLARPIDYQIARLATEVGASIPVFLPQAAMFVVASMVLGLRIPSDPKVWALFLCSGLLGLAVMFFMQFLLGCLTFWMEAIFGLRDIVVTAGEVLSGRLLPVSVLPGPVRSVAGLLPFQCTLFIPLSIFQGGHSGSSISHLLAIQAVWAVVLLVVSRLVWHLGLSKYDAQGG